MSQDAAPPIGEHPSRQSPPPSPTQQPQKRNLPKITETTKPLPPPPPAQQHPPQNTKQPPPTPSPLSFPRWTVRSSAPFSRPVSLPTGKEYQSASFPLIRGGVFSPQFLPSVSSCIRPRKGPFCPCRTRPFSLPGDPVPLLDRFPVSLPSPSSDVSTHRSFGDPSF